MSILSTMQTLEEDSVQMGTPPQNENATQQIGSREYYMDGTLAPENEFEAKEWDKIKAEQQTPAATSTDIPKNLTQTGMSVTTTEPKRSITEKRTDYKSVPTYEDWSTMQGNEPWELYRQKMGIKEPEKPELDENRQRRLQKYALLNDIGQGLFTLGEAFGLNKGASVRQRNIPQSPQLAEIDTLQKAYLDQKGKYPHLLQNYYKSVHDYEQARHSRYLKEHEAQGTKVSTTTTNGGVSETQHFTNPEWETLKHKRSLERAKAGRTQIHTGTWHTYPINGSDYYSYDFGKDNNNLRTSSNFARNELSKIANRLPKDISKGIASTIAKPLKIKGIIQSEDISLEKALTYKEELSDNDNLVFNTEVVRGFERNDTGIKREIENIFYFSAFRIKKNYTFAEILN